MTSGTCWLARARTDPSRSRTRVTRRSRSACRRLPSAGRFSGPVSPGTFACQQSQVFPVTFTPQAEGPVQTIVTVTGTPGGNKTVTLKGDGCIPNAIISVPPAPFPAFGDVRQGYRCRASSRSQHRRRYADVQRDHLRARRGVVRSDEGVADPSRSGARRATYSVDPTFHCGGGATGDGADEVVVVFFANAAPPKVAERDFDHRQPQRSERAGQLQLGR